MLKSIAFVKYTILYYLFSYYMFIILCMFVYFVNNNNNNGRYKDYNVIIHKKKLLSL